MISVNWWILLSSVGLLFIIVTWQHDIVPGVPFDLRESGFLVCKDNSVQILAYPFTVKTTLKFFSIISQKIIKQTYSSFTHHVVND